MFSNSNSKIQIRNKKLLQNVTDRLVLAGWRLPINAARAIYYVGLIRVFKIRLRNIENCSFPKNMHMGHRLYYSCPCPTQKSLILFEPDINY